MLRKLSGNNVPHCRLIYPTAGRRQGAVAGPAGAITASGLRVSPCWHPQNLLDLRTPGRLATRCHHPAAHHAGLCPPDVMARGRGLPPSSGGPSCPGQPEHPPCGLPLRDLSRSRGPSHRETPGVMAEIEFSVLSRDCLQGRLCDPTQRPQATINWSSSTHGARSKLHRLHPMPFPN